jgi:hypothetical protein
MLGEADHVVHGRPRPFRRRVVRVFLTATVRVVDALGARPQERCPTEPRGLDHLDVMRVMVGVREVHVVRLHRQIPVVQALGDLDELPPATWAADTLEAEAGAAGAAEQVSCFEHPDAYAVRAPDVWVVLWCRKLHRSDSHDLSPFRVFSLIQRLALCSSGNTSFANFA